MAFPDEHGPVLTEFMGMREVLRVSQKCFFVVPWSGMVQQRWRPLRSHFGSSSEYSTPEFSGLGCVSTAVSSKLQGSVLAS